MIIQIRRSCFETNSSSTHSLYINKLSKDEVFMGEYPNGNNLISAINEIIEESGNNYIFKCINNKGNIELINKENMKIEEFSFGMSAEYNG